MQTAAQAHERVQRAAAVRPEVRDARSLQVGEVVRQGDVYLHRVDDDHPHGPEATSRQLAIGTSQGSRHIAETGAAQVFQGTALPQWCEEGTFVGPCLVIPEGSTETVTHPEHAHVLLGPGTYQVTHQTDAATRQRVQD